MGRPVLSGDPFLLFFDPNGIRREISSGLDGNEEDLASYTMRGVSETELRTELETISADKP